MSSLSAVFAEMFTELRTLVPAVSTDFGARAQPFHEAPPRVVAIPTGGPIGAPRPSEDAGRRLYGRKPSVTVVLWAEGTDALEALQEAFLTCFEHACGGTGRPVSEQWVTELGVMSLGDALSLEVVVDVPVRELPAPATRTVTSVAFDTSTADPTNGTLQAGEPQ